jgi:hypothetical protein
VRRSTVPWGAMGDFGDLASPYLVGHSAGVAELVAAAPQQCCLEAADLVRVRRGAAHWCTISGGGAVPDRDLVSLAHEAGHAFS